MTVAFFNKEIYDGYIEQQQKCETKFNQLIRGIIFFDTLLFIALSGKNWAIPSIGVAISDLPVIKEVFIFMASFAFLMMSFYFVTNHCYSYLIDQFGNIIVDENKIDSDFYNASKKHFDFALKAFHPKLKMYGPDFFEATKIFKVFCYILTGILLIACFCLLIMHYLLIFKGCEALYSYCGLSPKNFLIITTVTLMNLGGLLYMVGIGIEFKFKVNQTENIHRNT